MVILNDIEDERDGGEAPTSVALELAAAAAVAAPAVPELPIDALHLPKVSADGGDPYWRLATAFLVGYPPHSSAGWRGCRPRRGSGRRCVRWHAAEREEQRCRQRLD